MRIYILALSLLLLNGACIEEEQKDISYLKTFAKAYGYVKYFHPSNEATSIDWNTFAVLGAREVSKCHDEHEVIATLNRLFKPIAPSIIFSNIKQKFDTKSITPNETNNYKLTYWQHNGVRTGMSRQEGVYNSIRVNQNSPMHDSTSIGHAPLFEAAPQFGETINKEIGKHIYCQIPLTLYSNEQGTYPQSMNLEVLKDQLSNVTSNPTNLQLRLGNVINVYNVFQHFYPYFDVVDVNWDKQLEIALRQSHIDQSGNDHLITLQKLTATLKDGHVYVGGYEKGWNTPPIAWEWIENKLVITEIFDKNLNIGIGDIVTKINEIPSETYFEEINSRISAGTVGYLNHIAKITSLRGEVGSEFKIEINNKPIVLNRTEPFKYKSNDIEIQQHEFKILDDNIYYLNLSKIEMDSITKLLPELSQANGIICDLRGYPKGNHEIISHLLSERDTSTAWMRVPQIIYPDQENISGYENHGWEMEPKEPYLGDKKIVFIIDGRAISYAESFMSFIKGYNLATIIGQPTAGTNGNINPFNIAGGYRLNWTGMKVVKHDGSQLHGIGIIPDIYVEKSIDGLKAEKDEFLEEAIAFIKK